MIIEILGTRIIGPVFGVSLFVWSALLAVTLASLAVGYYTGGLLADRAPTAGVLGRVTVTAGLLLGVAPAAIYFVLAVGQQLGPRLGPLLSATLLFAPCLMALGAAGPIAVRLGIEDVLVAGRRVGTIYAVSTAGSLAGTLLTAFVLIPLCDTHQILFGTASLLIATGGMWLANRKASTVLVLLLVPALALLGTGAKLPAGIKILSRSQSLYGLVEVIDDAGRGVRFLRADHSVIGAQFVADRTAGFAFLHLLEVLRFMRPSTRHLLQIGLGIGSLPTALQPYGMISDVVEIDPVVVRFARQYFHFSTPGHVFVEDARTFLRRTDRKYDVIVHDAFTGGATPEHLLSVEVFQRIRQMLTPGGVLALNFPGYPDGPGAQASEAIARTLRTVFSSVRAFADSSPEDRTLGVANITFFASDAPLSFEIPADARFENGSCRSVLRSFVSWEVLRNVPDGPLITDRWNPLTRLQLAVAEAHFEAMNELLPREVWLQ